MLNRLTKSALLIAIFGGAILLTAYLLPQLPIRPLKNPYPRVQYTASFEVPEDPDYFFAHSRQAELSHAIMYHGLNDSMDHARNADVIFIGNSRMPLGLREEFLMPKAQKLGVSLYSFGFGHVEKARFGLALIQKFNLKPKVVVVAGGPGIFNDGYSAVGAKAISMTKWDAMKHWFEGASWWNLKRRMHTVLPKVEFFDGRVHAQYIHYRSSRTGWWKTVLEPGARGLIGFGQERKSYEDELPMAKEFKQEMDRIDALLVLTVVPHRDTRMGHLPYFSDKLDVPMIVPSFDGLRMADGSHLSRESAKIFSDRFWEVFIANPHVREKLFQ